MSGARAIEVCEGRASGRASRARWRYTERLGDCKKRTALDTDGKQRKVTDEEGERKSRKARGQRQKKSCRPRLSVRERSRCLDPPLPDHRLAVSAGAPSSAGDTSRTSRMGCESDRSRCARAPCSGCDRSNPFAGKSSSWRLRMRRRCSTWTPVGNALSCPPRTSASTTTDQQQHPTDEHEEETPWRGR